MTTPTTDDTAPTWHPIPVKRRITSADLPRDGARVMICVKHLRKRRLPDRIGYWDAKAQEWWGMWVDGRAVDWRWAMGVAKEWREYKSVD